jgi:hypothetical protein
VVENIGAHGLNFAGRKLSRNSSLRTEFVNALDHRGMVALNTGGMKMVDSSILSQKPCPWRLFMASECGKTEEGFGKKGGSFWVATSKKWVIGQGWRQAFLGRGTKSYRNHSKAYRPPSSTIENTQQL